MAQQRLPSEGCSSVLGFSDNPLASLVTKVDARCRVTALDVHALPAARFIHLVINAVDKEGVVARCAADVNAFDLGVLAGCSSRSRRCNCG